MKNTKIGILFSVLAIMLLLVSGCTESPTGGAVSGKKVIKVGVLAALTGDVATIGISAAKSIELAADKFNAEHKDVQVKLILEDTKCDGATSATAANKLINVDKVDLIVGALCSGATMAAAPIAEANRVVMLSGCSTAPAVTDAGDYVFRTSPSDTYQGAFAAEYAYNELGRRKVAIIYTNTDWGFGVQEVFADTFKKLGGSIVAVEGIERESQDLRSQLTKVNSKNPDLIYTPLYSQNQGLIAKQAKEMGIKAEILGGDAAKDPNTVTVGGSSTEGLKFVAPKTLNTPKFEKELKDVKGVNIELCTPFSYDAANIMFNAIEKVGSNPEKVKQYLYSVKGYDGVSGTISIDENGDRANAEYSVYQIINGEFVAIY